MLHNIVYHLIYFNLILVEILYFGLTLCCNFFQLASFSGEGGRGGGRDSETYPGGGGGDSETYPGLIQTSRWSVLQLKLMTESL